MRGRVVNVVIRGEEAYVDGVVIARPGLGRNIRATPEGRATVAGGVEMQQLQISAGDAAAAAVSPLKKQQQQQQSMRERLESDSAASVAAAAAAAVATKADSDTSSPLPSRAHSPSGDGLDGCSVIAVADLTKAMVHRILDLADRFKQDIERGLKLKHIADVSTVD